jgi:hypothetical protein
MSILFAMFVSLGRAVVRGDQASLGAPAAETKNANRIEGLNKKPEAQVQIPTRVGRRAWALFHSAEGSVPYSPS